MLFEIFALIYRQLSSRGILKQYEVLGGQLLILLEGTEYFSSVFLTEGQYVLIVRNVVIGLIKTGQ